MKIIKNNVAPIKEKIKSKFPMKVKCFYCDSEFEIDESDVEVCAFGAYELDCPCCGKRIELDDGCDLTSENLEYPKHYFDFSDGVDLSNEDINEYVRRCIDCLRESEDKNLYTTTTGTGNTIIFVTRYDDDEEFCVDVCKRYQETNVPYTDEDKEKWCED